MRKPTVPVTIIGAVFSVVLGSVLHFLFEWSGNSPVVASIVQFAVGGVWYSVLFGKMWGKIHGFDKLSKEVQQKMMKEMGPYYALQAVVTVITSIIFAVLLNGTSDNLNAFILALLLWIGLVVPTQVSAVIFGGTESKWILKKVAIQAGASLACLQSAAIVFHILG